MLGSISHQNTPGFMREKRQSTLQENVNALNGLPSSISRNASVKEFNLQESHALQTQKRNSLLNLRPLDRANDLQQLLDRETSSLKLKNMIGSVYTWGQNNEGQLGSIPVNVTATGTKVRNGYPRLLVPLQNVIVTSIACGHMHTLIITLDQKVFAWGSNKTSQLGLGPHAPEWVPMPLPIRELSHIVKVAGGSEHSLALDSTGQVYSWGHGEGGLLGHGDCTTQKSPLLIATFVKAKLSVCDIACGGLHSLALTKEGHVFSWGRGEGGQLGHPFEELTRANDLEIYYPTPKRIRGLEKLRIRQIQCGDAHSLALAFTGFVYGWGYTNSGQLGTGVASNPENPQAIQIREPIILDKLTTSQMKNVFAGSTFSIFQTKENQLMVCGLNDYGQLGLALHSEGRTGFHSIQDKTNPTNPSEQITPKRVDSFDTSRVYGIACGENHSMAVSMTADGKGSTLWSWGIKSLATRVLTV
jgi:alpha-tubulin suppressor-like RCC1 family protein